MRICQQFSNIEAIEGVRATKLSYCECISRLPDPSGPAHHTFQVWARTRVEETSWTDGRAYQSRRAETGVVTGQDLEVWAARGGVQDDEDLQSRRVSVHAIAAVTRLGSNRRSLRTMVMTYRNPHTDERVGSIESENTIGGCSACRSTGPRPRSSAFTVKFHCAAEGRQ